MIYCTCQQLSLQRKEGIFRVLDAVAKAGDHELFVELCKYGYFYDIKTFAAAASCGSLEIVGHLHENDCLWDSDVFMEAARAGHLHIVQYLDLNGCIRSGRSVDQVISSGNVELLDYLYSKKSWKSNPFRCTVAVDCEDLKIVKYLHQKGNPLEWHAAACAAAKGNLPILQYLHISGCPWNEEVRLRVARKGNLQILQYLHDHCRAVKASIRRPWNINLIMSVAMLQGNVEIVKYLYANGCSWTTDGYQIALREKHTSLLDWLNTTDCPK